MNSRGLLSPRFLTSAQYWRLQRRESATWIHQTIFVQFKDRRCSASLQTPFFALSIFPRVQEPAAIRPYGLRVFQTHCWAVSYEQWDMNFVKSYELAQNILLYFCQKRIRVPSKFFTKPYFCINPAGKSKVPSWKIFISQLENYFFSVGKSKFRSRAK